MNKTGSNKPPVNDHLLKKISMQVYESTKNRQPTQDTAEKLAVPASAPKRHKKFSMNFLDNKPDGQPNKNINNSEKAGFQKPATKEVKAGRAKSKSNQVIPFRPPKDIKSMRVAKDHISLRPSNPNEQSRKTIADPQGAVPIFETSQMDIRKSYD